MFAFSDLRQYISQHLPGIRHKFVTFHFKNWHEVDKQLVFFRGLSIILLIESSIKDTLMFSSLSSEKSTSLKFLHGTQYIVIEIAVIIYTSGLAAFGLSVEVYLLLPHAIANSVVASKHCGGSNLAISESFWVAKMIFMVFAVEMCYRNLRRRPCYVESFNRSARAMLKQALLFCGTVSIQNLSGVRAVYHTTYIALPDGCDCVKKLQNCYSVRTLVSVWQRSLLRPSGRICWWTRASTSFT